MTIQRIKLGWLALPLLFIAVVAQAQTTEVEMGFRWLDLSGNESMYRSQINEREGFVLRTFSYWSEGAADRYRIDAFDLGTTPAGAFRFEAERSGTYHLRLGYRSADAFSALPGFANPLLSQGIILGQHTLDQTRTMLDADIEFRPDRKIVPFIGYTRNEISGPRRTTYHVGQDEFRLRSDLEDLDQEFRGGFTFNLGKFYGQVTQGWRDFSGTELLTLDAGASAGNNTNPVLGQPVAIETLTRRSRTDVTTPFTNAFITGQLTSDVKVIANYVRFSAETEADETESLAGTLVSFPLSRFYEGLIEQTGSRADNTTWRGEGRAEIALGEGLDLLFGFRQEHRELGGTSVISSLFVESITFGGADLRDLETVLNTSNALERDEQVLSATFSARALGPFTFRARFSDSDQEVLVKPDLAEIVIDGAGGAFNRNIRTLETTGTFSKNGLTVGASWRRDRADDPIFRTDFLDRDRYRVRTSWTAQERFRIGITAERVDQMNDREGIGFDGSVRQYSGDLELTPVKMLQLRASGSRFKADTSVAVRRPENFLTETMIYAEKGTGYGGGLSLLGSKMTFDADLGRFENEGSTPFIIDRYRGRLVYDFALRAGVAAEWSRDQYREELASFGDFEATRYGLFVRFRR